MAWCSRGPFNPNCRLPGDQFQRDIVYRRPIFRRRGILRYVTRPANFPSVLEQNFCGARDRLRYLQALSRERVIAPALLRRKARYHETTDNSGKFLSALI